MSYLKSTVGGGGEEEEMATQAKMLPFKQLPYFNFHRSQEFRKHSSLFR